jgi:probable rRNA maturation factor
MSQCPVLTFLNRQRQVRFDMAYVKAVAKEAIAPCLEASLTGGVLADLQEIEITVVSDQAIGRVHRDFFDDPSATDVITFPHGEILLGASTIASNAREYGHQPSEELALCVVHGFMHLGGWDDLTAKEAQKMARRQEQIFKSAAKVVGLPAI